MGIQWGTKLGSPCFWKVSRIVKEMELFKLLPKICELAIVVSVTLLREAIRERFTSVRETRKNLK